MFLLRRLWLMHAGNDGHDRFAHIRIMLAPQVVGGRVSAGLAHHGNHGIG
jgi:hypothetical protein